MATIDLDRTRREGQTDLDLLCDAHLRTCHRARCFVRDNKKAVFFCHQVPEEGDVPDCLQDGHGAVVESRASYSSRLFDSPLHPPIVVVSQHRGASITVRCTCSRPGAHPFLLEAICVEYNKL